MNKLLLAIFTSAMIFSPLTQAALIGIDQVYGENSLYTTDWGHSYNNSGGGNEYNALGRGDPAEAWQDTPNHAYAFQSNQHILLEASGCVVDFGATCTGPDYNGGDFRGLPVYSLIGIWSLSSNNIDRLATNYDPFYIGSLLDLWVPSNGHDSLYLFLATNDGIFKDNTCGSYSTNPCVNNYPKISQTYTVKISEVPLPASFWLMLPGLVLLRKLRKV